MSSNKVFSVYDTELTPTLIDVLGISEMSDDDGDSDSKIPKLQGKKKSYAAAAAAIVVDDIETEVLTADGVESDDKNNDNTSDSIMTTDEQPCAVHETKKVQKEAPVEVVAVVIEEDLPQEAAVVSVHVVVEDTKDKNKSDCVATKLPDVAHVTTTVSVQKEAPVEIIEEEEEEDLPQEAAVVSVHVVVEDTKDNDATMTSAISPPESSSDTEHEHQPSATTSTINGEEQSEEEDEESSIPPPPPPPRATTSPAILIPPPPPPPPVVLIGIDSTRRTALHHKLRAYEANRRASHCNRISSSSLYWRSFRALIHSSIEETKRAELIFKANAAADATYAQHMKALFLNFVNDDGTPMLDEKKRQRILKERTTQKDGDSYYVTSISTTPSAMGTTTTSTSTSTTTVDRSRHSSLILGNIIDSHLVIADRFDETSTGMNKDIIPQLVALREQLEEQVKIHETLGNAILEDLEAADNAVVDAWDAYYTIAVKAVSSSGHSNTSTSSHSQRRKGACSSSTATTTSHNKEQELISNSNASENDVWLAEMKYRVAVAYVSALWEKASSELSRLFTRLKETECQRRFRLADLLQSFLKKKESLFLSLPSILTPALQEYLLSERRSSMDSAAIEDDVQTSIRIRAQSMKKAEIEAKKAVIVTTNKKQQQETSSSSTGLLGVDISNGKFELTSPLTSELLCKARVVERKIGGVMMGGGWKPSLAVVTVDDFLHLFDISSTLKIGCGSAPEVAFHTLMPPIAIPTQETITNTSTYFKTGSSSTHDGKSSSSHTTTTTTTKWSDLSPSMSIVLPNSIISFQDNNSSSSSNSSSKLILEITETYLNQGASQIFGKTSTRKVQIRSSTREEILDWVAFLKAEK